MSAPDSSDKSHLFKSTWNHKETKVIRVPVVFADVVLEIARKLDAGESLDEISALIEQTRLALDWERCHGAIESALKDVPLGSRSAVQGAIMKLLALAYHQASGESLKTREPLVLESSVAQKPEKPLRSWKPPEQMLDDYVQQQQARLSSQEQTQQLTIDSVTARKIAGIALLILDLLHPHANQQESRTVGGKHFYSFVQQSNGDLFVLSVESPLHSEHYTVLRLHRDVSRRQAIYHIDSSWLQIKDIERFAVAAHHLEKGIARASSQFEQETVARSVLNLL